MGREATDQELSGAVTCDGLGSSFAALFGVLPNTSFSQNVGLGATNGAIVGLGSNINLVFGGSGIVPAALLAIALNLLIPKEAEDHAAEQAAVEIAALKERKLAEMDAPQGK